MSKNNTNNIDGQYSIGYSENITNIFAKRNAKRNAGFLLPYLKPNMRLLDCGCGPGSITVDFAKLLYMGSVEGIDIEGGQLERAQELAKNHQLNNITFRKTDIRHLPYLDQEFDVAFTNGVLCQIKDPENALRELKRVVKRGGIVASREPDFDTYLFYPDNPLILEAMSLGKKALSCIGGDFNIGRKLKKLFVEEGLDPTLASATCDTYGGTSFSLQEACEAMSHDWKNSPWGNYVLEQEWATPEQIEKFQQAFLTLGRDPGGFICLTWFELIGRIY